MTVLQPEVLPYLAAVRAALADLSPEERDDLLEDLEGHLAEVAVETDGRLEERLGPAAAYAAELRASAGLPARAEPRAFRDRLGDRVRRLRAAVEGLPGGRELVAFLPELRPGWWVVRAWLALMGLSVLLGTYRMSAFPLPRVLGSELLGLAALAVAVVLSVRIGQGRVSALRRRPVLVNAGNVAIGLLTIYALALAHDRYSYVHFAAGGPYAAPVDTYLQDGNGPITNIYPFDALGRPLYDVQLFDQGGRPIDDLLLHTPDGAFAQPKYPFADDGTPRRNVFPRSYRADGVGSDGRPTTVPVPPPAVYPPRIVSSPAASAAPSPSAPPSPAPSASPSAAPTPR